MRRVIVIMLLMLTWPAASQASTVKWRTTRAQAIAFKAFPRVAQACPDGLSIRFADLSTGSQYPDAVEADGDYSRIVHGLFGYVRPWREPCDVWVEANLTDKIWWAEMATTILHETGHLNDWFDDGTLNLHEQDPFMRKNADGTKTADPAHSSDPDDLMYGGGAATDPRVFNYGRKYLLIGYRKLCAWGRCHYVKTK